ncbi:uncharacterized protein LOC117175589 [Belonocnema kinseyi]|uniref:uncharacterized protein LOC117175589 n=1 Tax=Belonocnema kinseyi TaxID=2817044 RepID=UPI00143D7A3C|nr:uncharacterized protein LOC117175589 [Belonocnema kinseyi]
MGACMERMQERNEDKGSYQENVVKIRGEDGKISTDEVHENVVIVGAHNVEQKVFDNIRVVASVPDYAIPSTSAEVNIDATTFSRYGSVQATLLRNANDGPEIHENAKNGVLGEKLRRAMVRLLVAELIAANGNSYYPTVASKTALAEAIVSEYPLLKDCNEHCIGYEHYFNPKSHQGFIEYRLQQVRLSLSPSKKAYKGAARKRKRKEEEKEHTCSSGTVPPKDELNQKVTSFEDNGLSKKPVHPKDILEKENIADENVFSRKSKSKSPNTSTPSIEDKKKSTICDHTCAETVKTLESKIWNLSKTVKEMESLLKQKEEDMRQRDIEVECCLQVSEARKLMILKREKELIDLRKLNRDLQDAAIYNLISLIDTIQEQLEKAKVHSKVAEKKEYEVGHRNETKRMIYISRGEWMGNVLIRIEINIMSFIPIILFLNNNFNDCSVKYF